MVAVMLCWVASACGSDVSSGHSAPSSIRTDSAGVEIVLNPAAAEVVPVFATVDSVPSLTLGALDGRPEEQFGSIADVLPLSDGGVAVLDGQAAEIRVFDESGTYRTTLGSKGDGPGELRVPSALGLVGDDTLAVFDRRSMRVTRFALAGGIGAVTTLAAEGRRPINRAVFLVDGRLVGQSPWTADPSGRFEPPAEGEYDFVVDSALLAAYTPEASVLDTLRVLPNSETIMRIERDGQSLSLFRRLAVFGRSAVFQAHPDGVWSGFNDRFELQLIDTADGRLVRVVRAPGLERIATDEMAEEIRDYATADGDPAPERLRILDEWFAASPRPDRRPAYDRIVVDDQARLWVREWSGTGPSRRWWIFSGAGDLLGSADAPRGATLYSIRCGAAWAVVRDAIDVSYVMRYAVSVPGMEAGECGGGEQ
jgi:hypothetical protein